jgi:hypothetical protein
VALRPELPGKPSGFAFGRIAVSRSDEDSHAVVGRIAVDEPAKHGCIRNVAPRVSETIRVMDPLGIGAGTVRQQSHTCRRQRQAHTGLMEPSTPDHPGKDDGCLSANIGLIHMRIGAVADQAIGGTGHPVGQVCMQVERCNDGNIRTNALANGFQKHTIGVKRFDADHGPMAGDIDGIDRALLGQRGACRVQDAPQDRLVQRAAGLGPGHEHRQDLVLKLIVDLAQKCRNLGGLLRRIAGSIGKECCTLKPASRVKVGATRHGSETIAFKQKTENGNFYHGASGIGVCDEQA